MSDIHGAHAGGDSTDVDTVKAETQDVLSTAAEAATDVRQTAMDEASGVAHEATDQLRHLYDQTKSELSDEASKQQVRIASGLQVMSGDLDTMAGSAESGVAKSLVGETAQRVERIASWLGEREPGEVLDEVKAFARRQPGVFIGVSALAGVLAGRLTRALASHDTSHGASRSVDGSSTAGVNRTPVARPSGGTPNLNSPAPTSPPPVPGTPENPAQTPSTLRSGTHAGPVTPSAPATPSTEGGYSDGRPHTL